MPAKRRRLAGRSFLRRPHLTPLECRHRRTLRSRLEKARHIFDGGSIGTGASHGVEGPRGSGFSAFIAARRQLVGLVFVQRDTRVLHAERLQHEALHQRVVRLVTR
jgi:hypothetical protein